MSKQLTRQEVENYLENECSFRDYEFKPAKQFGKPSVAASINLLNPTKRDLDNALYSFTKDGFSTIIIYLDSVKRIKQVFNSSSEVLHLWANQTQASARQGGGISGGFGSRFRSSGSRCFFEGESCYSYGTHYELGRLVKYNGHTVAIINDEGYSHTTSKHIREAWHAVEHMPRIKCSGIKSVKDGLLEMQGRLVDELTSYFRQRKFWNGYNPFDRDSWFTQELNKFNATCLKLGFKQFILNVTDDYKQLVLDHIKSCVAKEEAKKTPEGIAKLEAARAKKVAAQVKKAQEHIDNWRLGGNATNAVSSLNPQILRINNGYVETSRGAKVPLQDAVHMLTRINHRVAKSGDKIGVFQLDSIRGNTVQIGCHTIDLDEAKRVIEGYFTNAKYTG